MPGKQEWVNASLALYDLLNDPGEASDVALEHPDVVEQLLNLVSAARDDLGDGTMRRESREEGLFSSPSALPHPRQKRSSAGTIDAPLRRRAFFATRLGGRLEAKNPGQ